MYAYAYNASRGSPGIAAATRLVAALRPQRRLRRAPLVLHQRLKLDSRVGRRGGVASVGGMGAWAVEAEVMVGVWAHHLVKAKAWSPLLPRHANEPRAGSPQHTCRRDMLETRLSSKKGKALLCISLIYSTTCNKPV